MHSRRTKSIGTETLPTKLSKHENSGGEKKGRYGVTVPKPFAFDIREKTRPKSIREHKVELMLEEKRLEEDEHIKFNFHPKPIPSNVIQPRYEKIMLANEERREKVKK